MGKTAPAVRLFDIRLRRDTELAVWFSKFEGGPGEWNNELAPLFERKACELFRDSWAARDSYIAGILDRSPENTDLWCSTEQPAEVVVPLRIGLNLWKVQNTYWQMLQTVFPAYRDRVRAGNEEASAWVRQFLAVGELLEFAVNQLTP